jgi:hypothetical protein
MVEASWGEDVSLSPRRPIQSVLYGNLATNS